MNAEELVLAALIMVAIVAIAVVRLRAASVRAKFRRERLRVAEQLYARFGAAPEFVEFAQSTEGRALLEHEYSPAATAHRLLGMVQIAIVLCAIGGAFLINGVPPPEGTDINFVREADNARWWGLLMLSAGIGLLGASAVTVRLARRWGVLAN